MAQIDDGFFTIEGAWWKWLDENCPSSSSLARGKWMRENVFTYEGVKWRREVTAYKSNSGKIVVIDRSTVFLSEDGRTIRSDTGEPNRRNDADRN